MLIYRLVNAHPNTNEPFRLMLWLHESVLLVKKVDLGLSPVAVCLCSRRTPEMKRRIQLAIAAIPVNGTRRTFAKKNFLHLIITDVSILHFGI